jgi:lipopolysaccharide/colanic/teichoic acid biosynthesis glycosyltransferase
MAPLAERGKRALDVLIGSGLLGLTLPLQIAVALAVVLDSPGPAIHRATRVGLNGKEFTVLKFRTMRANASAAEARITGKGDPRVTRVGRVLRRTKLDELPQLWNVVRGDMSLVGPRPEDPFFVRLYTPQQREVLSVRPGITGVSQLAYRNEESLLSSERPETIYVSDILPRKLELDLDYVRQRSLLVDLRILASTARRLVR